MSSSSDLPPAVPQPSAPPRTAEAPTPASEPEAVHEVLHDQAPPIDEPPSIEQKVINFLVGRPLDLGDHSIHQHISLVAFLAWVGLGADGLSSSCYGPSEAFKHLLIHDSSGNIIADHSYLTVFLALATIFTVCIISLCYSQIIAAFPSGGGGYLVASKLLGRPAGVVSGCALVVDYILTVTVSIAAAGDALSSLAGKQSEPWKLPLETAAIVMLILINLRGVKESVTLLMPIFITFLVTHAILIFGVLALHASSTGEVLAGIQEKVQENAHNPNVGYLGMIALFLYAYSLGAGTYTGIEAVSNSMPVMREPKVATAQRTMIYMAASLALTAGGLMVAYLLLGLSFQEGKTMNFVLTEKFAEDIGLGGTFLGSGFVWLTMLCEGALLFVAAQAGFIDGPRVLANMAHDSFVPHWLGSLSERLSTHYGILFIGLSALAALWSTGGQTEALVIMYSINVFLTFSLSMVGMCLHSWQDRVHNPRWWWTFALFLFGGMMCLSILAVTVYWKFHEGGWKTVAVTGLFCGLCFIIRRYYRDVSSRLRSLDESLAAIPAPEEPNTTPLDPEGPTAVILVGGYSGIGVHTLLGVVRFVPRHFKQMVFVSVGVVDSGNFKGADEMEALRQYTERSLRQYVDLARRLGYPATSYMSIGTDVVDELEQVCRVVARDYPTSMVFAGQLVFQRDTWYGHWLHNQTAYSLQRRLQFDGIQMVILATRVR